MRGFLATICICALLLGCSSARASDTELYPYYRADSCGLINVAGQPVTKQEYVSIAPVVAPDGARRFLAYTCENENYFATLLDENGQPLTDITYDSMYLDGDTLIMTNDGQMGVLGWDGIELLPTRYSTITTTGKGTFITSTDDPFDDIADEMYLTDSRGVSRYINLCVSYISSFSDGLACARARNGKYGYLDYQGQWAIAPIYDSGENFSGGKAVVWLNGQCGLIDSAGNTILPIKYDFITASPYADKASLIITVKSGAATLYDVNTLIPLSVVENVTYGYLPGFDLAILAGDDFMGVYDSNGTELLRVGKDKYIDVLGANRALVADYMNNEAQVVDFFGHVKLSGISGAYSLYWDDMPYAICVANGDGLMRDAEGNVNEMDMRWGIYDFNGNEILPTQFDSIILVCKGIFSVRQGDQSGLINSNGEWIFRETVDMQD